MTGPDDGLLLRRAVDADRDAVAGVHARARGAATMPPPVDDVGAWVAGWDLAETDVWVAERDGAVAGYARLTGDWLDDLYVDPDHQRAGVGSALLELVQGLRPGGFALWVFASNVGARRFYAAHGLVELERTDGSANAERAPDVRVAWPGERPLGYLRSAIDEVDDELASLLGRRFALAGAVQDHKRAAGGAGGHAGRDPGREAEIIDRMAALAPGIDRVHLARVMAVVLDEGLAAWERGETTGGV